MQQKQLLKPHSAQAEKIELLPAILLDQTKDARTAFVTMIASSGLTHESLASAIGKERETITRAANGNSGLKLNELARVIQESGNAYFVQYLANILGYELTPIDQKAKRRAELLAELEDLEKAA